VSNLLWFKTKGGISVGVLRVTYYISRGFVSCNFIFRVADPTIVNVVIRVLFHIVCYVQRYSVVTNDEIYKIDGPTSQSKYYQC